MGAERAAVIVERKSLRPVVVAAHEVRLVNYLLATGKPAGKRKTKGKRKVENLSQG